MKRVGDQMLLEKPAELPDGDHPNLPRRERFDHPADGRSSPPDSGPSDTTRRALLGGLIALGGGAAYLALGNRSGNAGRSAVDGAAPAAQSTSSTTAATGSTAGATEIETGPLVGPDRQQGLVINSRSVDPATAPRSSGEPSSTSTQASTQTTARASTQTTANAVATPSTAGPMRVDVTKDAPSAAARSSTTAAPSASPSSTAAPASSTSTTASGSATTALVVSTPTTDDAGSGSTSTTAGSTTTTAQSPQLEPPAPSEPPTTAPITSTPPPNGVSASFAAGRIAFGPTPALMADIDRRGVGGWLEDQLTRTGPDPEVESRIPGSSPVKQSREQLRGTNFRPALTHAVVYRARFSSHQLFEMVASMWADHFNVYLDQRPLFNPDYQENVIRPHAMGRFADLLLATAESEGMMFYLDNHLSDASKPAGVNENYGRELLELHTVGVGNHSEADVVAAAKAMTGWTIRGNPGTFTFVDRMHANEAVTVLGATFPAAGKAQGEALLDHLAHHPATARMVATKIARRFVADDPPPALIDSAAQVYLDNDTAIVPVLRHVLTSAAFADSAGQKLRRPMEYVVAALRATDANVAAQPERTLFALLGEMGNRPWDWPPPNGFPDVAPYWADTSGFALRWSFAARLLHNRLNGITVDLGGLRAGAATAGEYVTGLAGRFGIGSPSSSDVDAVLGPYGLAAGDPLGSLDDNTARDIAALLLCHPGFQLR